MADNQQLESEKSQLSIKAYYVRAASIETSASPVSIQMKQGPEMRLEIRVNTYHLGHNQDEVVLELNVSARDQNNLLYVMKIHQAGCFVLTNITPEQKVYHLNTTCANLLYPYASQFANTLAVQAGFPAVNLLPVDFGHLYQQQQEQTKQAPEAVPTTQAKPAQTVISSVPSQTKWAKPLTSASEPVEAVD